MEYLAHLIPEGGLKSMGRIVADGVVVVGDAAQLVNAIHREGSNLAMTSGRLAAQTILEAMAIGDFSESTRSVPSKPYEEFCRTGYEKVQGFHPSF